MHALTPMVLMATICLTGCANGLSIYRSIDTHGKSVALDAKQRVVLSVARPGAGLAGEIDHVICAEPSPDALSAYGASVAGTFSSSSEAQAQLATAIAEQSGSIGLRTQSIQLMRDAMYRACEGYLSGGISAHEFYLLQRRFQNLTVGLLAIEQLTGAVKSEQVSLSTSSGASTGDSVEAETAALARAHENESAAQGDLDAAKLKLRTSQDELSLAVAELAEAKKRQAAAPRDATQEQRDALKTAVDGAEEKRRLASGFVDQQLLEVASKERALRNAARAVTVATQNLQDARGRVRAFANGSAAVGMGGAARLAISDRVARTVASIVDKVFDESGTGEGCAAIIGDLVSNPKRYEQPGSLFETSLKKCLDIQELDAKSRATATR